MKILSKLVQTYWKLDIKLFPLCDVLQEIYDEAEATTRGALKNFAKFIGKRLGQSLFFNTIDDLQLYLKRGSGTGVSLWILRDFKNTNFYRTPLDQFFWWSFLWNWFTARSARSATVFTKTLHHRYLIGG